MKKYISLENKIIDVFKKENNNIIYKNNTYKIKTIGKPRPKKGECKTDVYILLENETSELEFKISIKMKNSNEFVENKITKDRAISIFGKDYKEVIKKSVKPIIEKFDEFPLIYKDKKGNVEEGSITMGWRFEILNKPRKLSSPLNLKTKEIVDCFYKGKNMNEDKKDSKVNGEVIKNSGIAEYILICNEEEINTYEDVFKLMLDLDKYKPEQLYISFISNNYRTLKDKIDGSRALAVYVDWEYKNNILDYNIKFEEPLEYTGKELSKILKSNMKMPKMDINKIKFSKKLSEKVYKKSS